MNHSTNMESPLLSIAKNAMLGEASAIEQAASRLDSRFEHAVEAILSCKGKVVLSAVGKSGHIARKIAATLCSTGTPAVFLHPTEALHGDLGVCAPEDVVLLISKSGSTQELLRLAPAFKQMGCFLLGLLGNLQSPLAQLMDLVLDASVEKEADPLEFVPTSSAAVALALGDALASALLYAKSFKPQDFAQYHPNGQLGRNLGLQVADVMHPFARIARISLQSTLRDTVIEMTRFPLGAACIVDATHSLLGIITDGDLRRALQYHDDIRLLSAAQIMTSSPITIQPKATLQEAIRLMEGRPSQISVLPVTDEQNKCLGLLRIHDIYQGAL